MPRLIKPLSPADPVEAITQRPPSDLGTEGRRLWRSLAPLPWVGRSDSIALHELCRLSDMAQIMRDDIVARGPSYVCRGRQYANPSVGMLMEAEKHLTAGLRAFGATPADRGKLGVAEPKPASKFELLQMRRAA